VPRLQARPERKTAQPAANSAGVPYTREQGRTGEQGVRPGFRFSVSTLDGFAQGPPGTCLTRWPDPRGGSNCGRYRDGSTQRAPPTRGVWPSSGFAPARPPSEDPRPQMAATSPTHADLRTVSPRRRYDLLLGFGVMSLGLLLLGGWLIPPPRLGEVHLGLPHAAALSRSPGSPGGAPPIESTPPSSRWLYAETGGHCAPARSHSRFPKQSNANLAADAKPVIQQTRGHAASPL